MKLQPPFRPATIADCRTIAELFQIASDGVTDYIWSTLTPEYPGLTPIEIGAKRYADQQNIFGYKNCVIAERNGAAIGMMIAFPTEPAQPEEVATGPAESAQLAESTPAEPDVLAPYSLEAPGTWYICALALFPEFRGQGIGSQFLAIAHQQAAERDFSELSLLCFEQNRGALRLYERHGFRVVNRVAVVPHPLIHYTGDLLLMTAPVQR